MTREKTLNYIKHTKCEDEVNVYKEDEYGLQ